MRGTRPVKCENPPDLMLVSADTCLNNFSLTREAGSPIAPASCIPSGEASYRRGRKARTGRCVLLDLSSGSGANSEPVIGVAPFRWCSLADIVPARSSGNFLACPSRDWCTACATKCATSSRSARMHCPAEIFCRNESPQRIRLVDPSNSNAVALSVPPTSVTMPVRMRSFVSTLPVSPRPRTRGERWASSALA